MTDGHVLSSSLVETVAGFTAGVISTLAVHPLDIVKTRLQGKALLP
jgi:solute carrier family 25 folate transporter 32